MSDGMEEIRRIFEEECAEGLDAIEMGLLSLDGSEDPIDTINDIFRGAHSIKGGAATFGYTDISEFTHIMETLLDKLRSGEMEISPPLVQLFLKSVDCMRDMMAILDGGDYDRELAAELTVQLTEWLGGDPDQDSELPSGVSAEAEEQSTQVAKQGWHIRFSPKPHMLQTGNQPQHLFKALEALGELSIKPDISALPAISDLDPEELFIKWDLELHTEVDKAQVSEIFDWVESECDLEITAMGGASKLEAKQNSENLQLVPSANDRRDGDRRGGDRRQTDRRGEKRGGNKESDSIRVDIDKIDALLNLVGEMVITQAMLSQYCRGSNGDEKIEGLSDRLNQLERNTRELQEAVMQVRMLPASVTFSRFPRLVHDLSTQLNKSVELEISGEQTELDKTVLEKIGDPLVHLVRNSLDHGIESTEDRLAAGKSEVGIIGLSASHEGGNIVIRVTDDGAGLNTEKILAKARERGLVGKDETPTDDQINDLIFHAGFSTADVVSDVSGRGVGMDVVRSNIQDIGGRVAVSSVRGEGSEFAITLPLTLAILDGQLVRVGTETYVVPLLAIIESVQIDMEKVNVISGGNKVYRLRGEAIPIIDTRDVLRVDGVRSKESLENKLLMFVEVGRKSVGLVIDELLEQHQVVIKSLETNYSQVEGMLGATILGDGRVSLIVDIPSLADLAMNNEEERFELSA